jgi:hypothetical protein
MELVNDQARSLFNNAKLLLARTENDKTKQKGLESSDSEIFQVKVSHTLKP